MNKVLAIVQARCSSTRLPNKVLKQLIGKPMLQIEIERVLQAKNIDYLVVATSTDPSDNSIEKLCREIGVTCARGSLADVLSRFYYAAEKFDCNHIVRITGDCPLIDPDVIDLVIKTHLEAGADYTSNTINETYPDGLDVEVFNFNALEYADLNATLASDREHVTPFIKRVAQEIIAVDYKVSLSEHRWTVDEEADFLLITKIFEHFEEDYLNIRMQDILEFLEMNTEIAELNSNITRNEGYQKSVDKD